MRLSKIDVDIHFGLESRILYAKSKVSESRGTCRTIKRYKYMYKYYGRN